MEQSKSPDRKLAQFAELADKLRDWNVVTMCILENMLPVYSRVASETGFKVEKIANEGEEFPVRSSRNGSQDIRNLIVQGKGYIAISIEGQKGKDHGPFWANLQSTEEYKKMYPSPKPATKS